MDKSTIKMPKVKVPERKEAKVNFCRMSDSPGLMREVYRTSFVRLRETLVDFSLFGYEVEMASKPFESCFVQFFLMVGVGN